MGSNGQGKSNLVEGIYLLAIGKTTRSATDQELVSHDIEFGESCSIKGIGSDGPVLFNIEFELTPDERTLTSKFKEKSSLSISRYKKTLSVNGAKVPLNTFIGIFNVVMFEANDLMLIFGSPYIRRRFLDIFISQTNLQYLKALQRYNRVIKNRNRILKNISSNKSKYDELKFWTDKLIEDGSTIMFARHKIIQKLLNYSRIIYKQLSLEGEGLEIEYKPKVKYPPDHDHEKKSFQKNYCTQLIEESIRKLKHDEIKHGSSLVGPHRDDLEIKLSGFNISGYASRGQIRSIVLALKLAEAKIISELKGSDPIILLDDVMSELDSKRRELVLELIESYDQVLITIPDRKLLDNERIDESTLFSIKKGSVNSLKNNGKRNS